MTSTGTIVPKGRDARIRSRLSVKQAWSHLWEPTAAAVRVSLGECPDTARWVADALWAFLCWNTADTHVSVDERGEGRRSGVPNEETSGGDNEEECTQPCDGDEWVALREWACASACLGGKFAAATFVAEATVCDAFLADVSLRSRILRMQGTVLLCLISAPSQGVAS